MNVRAKVMDVSAGPEIFDGALFDAVMAQTGVGVCAQKKQKMDLLDKLLAHCSEQYLSELAVNLWDRLAAEITQEGARRGYRSESGNVMLINVRGAMQ